MRVLVIKTSSLGDVIHTLPALTDAAKIYPYIEFDWVIEESFHMIPLWHKQVKKIIPLALRRWRKEWFRAFLKGEYQSAIKNIRQNSYDVVIDAQGLVKSAAVSLFARGEKTGFDFRSAREPLASLLYKKHANALWSEHAVKRTRLLFAQILNYDCPEDLPDYGIDVARVMKKNAKAAPYCVFLHGTTWETKHWPESYWLALAALVTKAGYHVKLLWGNAIEYERAKKIATAVQNVEVLAKLGLNEVASILANAKGIVSVDTGLGHLAAAFGVPTVSLYGPTDPIRTGMTGPRQLHLKSTLACSPCLAKSCCYPNSNPTSVEGFPPCYIELSPERVCQALIQHMQHITSNSIN